MIDTASTCFCHVECGTVRAGSHPGLLFKKLGKVMRIVSAANLFRNNLNFFTGSHILFRTGNPDIGQVIGKFAPGFFKKTLADVIYIHKQNLF